MLRTTLLATANTEGLVQAGELALAFALSMLIGVEREMRQKSAGLKTHTLVGMGSALFMLVSKYGFTDVARAGLVVVDPSRVAAQIVSGVGFLGAGLIFVKRDSVRGLTTAASVWVTAAVGAASGAGLPLLAGVTTGLYLATAAVFPAVARRLPHVAVTNSIIRVRYPDGRGTLREILRMATARGFTLAVISTEPIGFRAPVGGPGREVPMVSVSLRVHGRALVNDLVAELSELDGVDAVLADDVDDDDE